MKSAVITTGGKQYLVQEGSRIKVEKLETEAGKAIHFSDVLLVATDKTAKIGAPHISGAAVEGKIVRHGRHPKVVGVKVKAKKRYQRYFGHKQHFTEVEITKIASK